MMLVGALPLLAALVPDGHQVTMIDENVEEIDFDALKRFDLIGVTGMIVQKRRMDEILERLAAVRQSFVSVGHTPPSMKNFSKGVAMFCFSERPTRHGLVSYMNLQPGILCNPATSRSRRRTCRACPLLASIWHVLSVTSRVNSVFAGLPIPLRVL